MKCARCFADLDISGVYLEGRVPESLDLGRSGAAVEGSRKVDTRS